MQLNASDLPDGAVIDMDRSKVLHEKIRNNTKLRERIETAQRMTGNKALHLLMLAPGQMPESVKRALVKNQVWGQKYIKKRIKEENFKNSEVL